MKHLTDIDTTAKALFQLSVDLDYMDYAEQRDEILEDLKTALEEIKKHVNKEDAPYFWQTFGECMDAITNTTILNESIFAEA